MQSVEAIAIFLELKLMFYIKGAGKMNEFCHILYYYYYLEIYSKPEHSGLGKSLVFVLVGPHCMSG